MLEVYYGTPYDRHVILEESSDVRYRKRNSRGMEEPPGLGSRILRRLSSKTRDPHTMGPYRPSSSSHIGNNVHSAGGGHASTSGLSGNGGAGVSASSSGGGGVGGVENKGFQHDVPKSPWRYPFRRAQHVPAHPMTIQRTLSQDSSSSIASANAIQISPLHKHALSRMLP